MKVVTLYVYALKANLLAKQRILLNIQDQTFGTMITQMPFIIVKRVFQNLNATTDTLHLVRFFFFSFKSVLNVQQAKKTPQPQKTLLSIFTIYNC